MTANSTINILYVGIHIVIKQVFVDVCLVNIAKGNMIVKNFGCVIIVIIKFVDQDIIEVLSCSSMCGAQINHKKGGKDLNETTDQLAIANSV